MFSFEPYLFHNQNSSIMSVTESIEFAKRVMRTVHDSVPYLDGNEPSYPKKHVDRIAGAAETVFTYNAISDDQSLIDAVVDEDSEENDMFAGKTGFSDFQLAVNRYRNSL